MIKAFEEAQSRIKVKIVPCDFANAEQIIKTGIASGNPVDVSFFWVSAIKTDFVDNDQVWILHLILWQRIKNGTKLLFQYFLLPVNMKKLVHSQLA